MEKYQNLFCYFVEQESVFQLPLLHNHLKTHAGNHYFINLSNILLFVFQNKQLIKNKNGSPPVCYNSNGLKQSVLVCSPVYLFIADLIFTLLLSSLLYSICCCPWNYFCSFCFSLCNYVRLLPYGTIVEKNKSAKKSKVRPNPIYNRSKFSHFRLKPANAFLFDDWL